MTEPDVADLCDHFYSAATLRILSYQASVRFQRGHLTLSHFAETWPCLMNIYAEKSKPDPITILSFFTREDE